jgi:SAM-dependent methyltransferase
MDEFSFSEFYDRQQDYVSFRDDPVSRDEYNIAVGWKAANLCSLVDDTHKFSDVLEIGCALGILLNKLGEKLSVIDRTGIDISAQNIKLASELFPECKFIHGTIEDLNCKNTLENNFKRFDLVILSDIVEHIPDDVSFMKQVSCISRFVLLNLPLEKCYTTRNRKYGLEDPSGHLRSYNKKDAINLVRSSEFEIIKNFTENARFNDEYFQLFKRKRNIRLNGKKFMKKMFWKFFYLFEDLTIYISPVLYKRINGSNYFALLQSKNS